MNIFKILASGDGNINEPNVSAFLGYLLNPKADHGLGDELLKKLLNCLYQKNKDNDSLKFIVDRNEYLRNLSANSNFEIEVLLEQAFKSDDKKKEIVDIVILCREKNIEKKESLARVTLSDSNKGKLRQIFLIENKINKNSTREGQLLDQAKATIDTLEKLLEGEKNIEKLISLIFITPEGGKSDTEFGNFIKDKSVNIPKVHIHWDEVTEEDDSENVETIISFLKNILSDEVQGDIEAINEYTKHTIKSFITFIQNDFKSAIEEELEGKTIRDIYYDFDKFKAEYVKEENFNKYSCDLLTDFDAKLKSRNYKNIQIRHSLTHPISVFIKTDNKNKFGKKIFSVSRDSKNIMIHMVLRNHNISNDDKKILAEYFSTKFNVVYSESYALIIKPHKGLQFDIENILELFDKQYKMITKQNEF